jgi:hypothetical protein
MEGRVVAWNFEVEFLLNIEATPTRQTASTVLFLSRGINVRVLIDDGGTSCR